MHNLPSFTPTTHNLNNNYAVDIIVDPNLSGGSGSIVKYSSVSNSPFYELNIYPPFIPGQGIDTSKAILAGNIRIDGVNSEWSYITNLHPYGSVSCTPHPTPHGVSSQIAHTYMLGPGGTNCYAAPVFNNGSYDFQGPYTFTNDIYVNGDFLTDSNPVTWSKIHLIETYHDGAGNFYNDNLSPEIAENEKTWDTWTISKGTISAPGYPFYLKAFVYVIYDPNITITDNITLSLDIDEVEPVVGCMDPNAINGTYNSNATIDDPTLCDYYVPQYSITFEDTSSDVDSTGLYTPNFSDTGPWLNPLGSTDPPLKNFIFNNGFSYVLQNTYPAGASVTETVEIDLTPVNPTVYVPDFEAAYNYPISGVGPDGNISQTLTYQQDPSGWGEAKNNLTAASIRFLNTDGSSLPTYNDTISDYSLWHNNVDPTGYQPTQTVVFDDGIEIDLGEGTMIIDTDDITLTEVYYSSGAPELIDNPAYEWFPYKLTLSIRLDFVMPAHNLNIMLELDHNTENQGDFDWVEP
tara:strand:- start:1301 stop:2857 length:1557 start_codon:yes stop_codon:yes gene_type:complete